MSRKRTVYTTEFKTKMVLEVLKGEKTLGEIASKHNVLPKNLQNWKAKPPQKANAFLGTPGELGLI